jgi:hypothetical protein
MEAARAPGRLLSVELIVSLPGRFGPASSTNSDRNRTRRVFVHVGGEALRCA